MGLDPGAARERVRVARALGTLPLLAHALARGELSYAKVRALTRVATPETEERLLAVGLAGTAAHVERIVRGWRRVHRLAEARESARLLYEARAARVPIQPFTDAQPELGMEDGYAIQQHLVQRLLDDGEVIVGYKLGLTSLAFLTAAISINLAVLNLLPVPMLDGGHLLFFVIEGVRGRPLSLRKREVAQQVGLFLLLLLMVFAVYNDLARIDFFHFFK